MSKQMLDSTQFAQQMMQYHQRQSRSNSAGKNSSAHKSDQVGVIDLSKSIQRNFEKVIPQTKSRVDTSYN